MKAQSSKIDQAESIPQVVNMKREVEQNDYLRQILQSAIDFIPEGGVLYLCSVEDVFLMINFICTEPPKFENNSFVGIPFAALFIDLMNSVTGQ